MKWFILITVVLVAFLSSEAEENSCKDWLPDMCMKWRKSCHEVKHRGEMKHFCRKTCGYCGPGIPTHAPYTGKCGQPEVRGVRVIAGTTPPRGAWPWQILLSYKGEPVCGGTLISPQWVVSAAHCVFWIQRVPSDLVVRVGEYNRTGVEGSEVDVKVAKVFTHPGYGPFHANDDISLLKLSSPVKLNKYVQPACLPSEDPPVGSKCYITGWGKTHVRGPRTMTTVLQQGLLPVVSNKVCDEKNKRWLPVDITPDNICGGSGGTDRVNGCYGDSGGPFVCNLNGKWELHGSMSYGNHVCMSNYTYTVFSRTNYFKGWIMDMITQE